MTVWVDGGLRDGAGAAVSPFDHGLLTGDGVFETMRVYGGVPFAWTRHMERLRRSAEGLGLATPDPVVLRAAAEDVLRANGLREARLRVTVTGGPAPLGSERGAHPQTVILAASALPAWPPAATVAVCPWTRNERGALAGLKTISYAENVRALAWARERGAQEALFLNTRGELCEGTGTNLFLVEDGAVVTPPPSSGCLPGVTRALVLRLCEKLGIPADEGDRPHGALATAAEAFLTSTTREVQPIERADGRAVPAPGPVSAKLAAAFRELVATDPDP